MGTNIALPRSNGRPGFFQCVAPEALYTAHIEPHPSWDIKWISADPWTLSSHWHFGTTPVLHPPRFLGKNCPVRRWQQEPTGNPYLLKMYNLAVGFKPFVHTGFNCMECSCEILIYHLFHYWAASPIKRPE